MEPFVLEQVVPAPLTQVWRAFSSAEGLKKWMFPVGVAAGTSTMDFREGGMYHYELLPLGGVAFWGRWLFINIEEPYRIVTHVSFSDAGCGITRHPMAPDWPLECRCTYQFSESAEGTMIRLEYAPVGLDPTAFAAFEGGRASLNQGWGGTLNNLRRLLAEQP